MPYGYLTDADLWIAKGQSLPNAGSADSMPDGSTEGMVYVGDQANLAVVRVYAKDAWAIAEAATVTIKLEVYSSDAHASAVNPFCDGDCSLQLVLTGATGGTTLTAGDLVGAFAIPQEVLASYPYIQLKITTSADESSHEIDAFVSLV